MLGSAYMAHSQVICAVQSPAAIAGNYAFTWAEPSSGWSTPDFLIPGTFVEDTLVLVNDGTPGTNATYGNLLSEEGCAASPANAYAGKIAVIRRNTCEFGLKAKNAQDAGAVGVIIINRDPESIAMGAGAEGVNVTIPVVMISSTDGATILNQMLTDDVVAFIGNKAGLYNDDAGITSGTSLIAKSSGVPALVAQNGTEFNFDLGTRIKNYGIDNQTNVSITATITNPSMATVYNQTISSLSIASGDSIDVAPGETNSFPQFLLSSYPAGKYTLTYTLSIGVTDEYAADNTVSSNFFINDSIFSYAVLDENTGLPLSNNGYRPSTNNSTFSTCLNFSSPNASRLGAKGIYFSATTGSTSGVVLTGEEMALNLYRWEDVFTDLNDANLAFNALNPVAFGYYYYPADLQDSMVYGAFNTPVVLEDNQRYLACVQTVNTAIYLGHDTKTNYAWNEAYYLQPITPNESDGTWYASGFGADAISAVALKVIDKNLLGINEEELINGVAYPNPANDVVTISINATGSANLTVTDVAGKIVMNNTLSLTNGNSTVNIAGLETGVYIFNIVLENGKSSQINVVKK